MITATSKGLANEIGRPTRFEVEEAVRPLFRWAGDDPNRAGLLEIPRNSHERSKNTSREMRRPGDRGRNHEALPASKSVGCEHDFRICRSLRHTVQRSDNRMTGQF